VARRYRRPPRDDPNFRARRELGYLRGVAPSSKILVVDDSRTQLEWLVKLLEREGYAAVSASTGAEALRKVEEDPPDLLLLDMILSDMHGLEVLRIVKARGEDQFIPVIALSVKGDVGSKVTGLRMGADDFLAKPFAEAEILARCAAMLRIKQLQAKLSNAQRKTEEQSRKLEEQSLTDALTGLRNRRFLDERLEEEFKRAQRYGDFLSIIMIDLDHFKAVNDRFGHPAGDMVLREAAALIRTSIRDPDICARYGGEEFAVILPKTSMSGALAVAERVWRAIGAKEYEVPPDASGQRTVKVTASLGVAFYTKDITAGDVLLRRADEALYRAKEAGRNSICLHQAAPFRSGPRG
jgi:diguanylate cyclase (GGDEF)-like protein